MNNKEPKPIKITISSTGHSSPEPTEITTRKKIDGLVAGGEVLVRIKDELGTLSPFEPFVCIAALYADSFDANKERTTYYLARSGNDDAAKKAEETARGALEHPEAVLVSATFAAKEGESTALVKAEPVEAEIIPNAPEAEEDGRRPCGFKYDKDFKLSGEPQPQEIRAKLVEEIETAEKAAAAARTKMKKAASQIADAVDAGLSEAVALATYRESKEEWFAASNDLVGAQDRLRSFDASLKKTGAA